MHINIYTYLIDRLFGLKKKNIFYHPFEWLLVQSFIDFGIDDHLQNIFEKFQAF